MPTGPAFGAETALVRVPILGATATADEVHYESDYQQPQQDAETPVAEEQVQDVGEHQGMSDSAQEVRGATVPEAAHPEASPPEPSPAEMETTECDELRPARSRGRVGT